MEKIVVYCGTPNLYPFMYISMRTLLDHNDIDLVYFFITTDDFPYALPKNVKIINFDAIKLSYFPEQSRVYESPLTYMSFTRLVLSKLLSYDKVLYLDCDTIINTNIEELFSVNISDYCFGASLEKYAATPYAQSMFNSGILLINLARLRETGIDDRLLELSNRNSYSNGDQSILNTINAKEIITLASTYNGSGLCHNEEYDGPVKIRHFAGAAANRYYQEFNSYRRKYLPGIKLNPKYLPPQKDWIRK